MARAAIIAYAALGLLLGACGSGQSADGSQNDPSPLSSIENHLTAVASSRRDTFVGANPYALASDGAHVWVTRAGGWVTKLRAFDGAVVDNIALSGTVQQLAFTGTAVFVAHTPPTSPESPPVGEVVKIRVFDDAIVGRFPVGRNPEGVAFDGRHVWVANFSDVTVTKLRARDGLLLGTFPIGSFGGAVSVAYDRAGGVWVTNFSGSVVKLQERDGAILGDFPVGVQPWGLAIAGRSVWIADGVSDTVTKLSTRDGDELGTFGVGRNPAWVATDGVRVWVSNLKSNTLTELRARDGAVLGTIPVGTTPQAVIFDGRFLWVANYGDGTVSRIAIRRFLAPLLPLEAAEPIEIAEAAAELGR